MKKIIVLILILFTLIGIVLLFFVNKTREITNINAIRICQQKGSLEINLSESAHYIKSCSVTVSNSETLNVVISTVSVYAVGYGKLLSNVKFHRNENIKYIKVCDRIIDIHDSILYCK